MRWLLALSLLSSPLFAQHTLFATGSTTKPYVVGAKLPASGLFRRAAPGAWQHTGFNHPWLLAIAADPRDPAALLVAGGNGLIRASDRWTIVTGNDVTELRDVTVAGDAIYFAYCAGIRVSRDHAKTWHELAGGLPRKYVEAIRVDARDPRIVIAGGEDGIYRSEDSGGTWRLAGAAGYQVLRIEASPHDACFWLASTQGGGLFASRDCGRTFESNGNLGAGRNIYDVAFDPASPERIAAAVWGIGPAISKDRGKSWRASGAPGVNVSAVAFDPDHPGRLFAAIRELGVFTSDDLGATWARDGLEDTQVSRLKFVPEVRR